MEGMKKVVHYWEKHAKNVASYMEGKTLKTGDKCDQFMDDTSDKKKYVCEILLRIPLIFFIHQWLILSPYSSNWIVDVFVFIIRYGVAFLLFATWSCSSGALLKMFAILSLDCVLDWLRQISYWSYQEELNAVCHEKNVPVWSDITESWWIPALITLLIKIVYCSYRSAFFCRMLSDIFTWGYLVMFVTLIPEMFSLMWIFPSFMPNLSYWMQSTSFTAIFILEVLTSWKLDSEIVRKKINALKRRYLQITDELAKRDCKKRIEKLVRNFRRRREGELIVGQLPGKFVRDTMLAFGIPYLFFAVLIEVMVYRKTVTFLFTLDSFVQFLTRWCTSSVVIVFVSYGYGFFSNVCVFLCNFIITYEGNIFEMLNANIGVIVQMYALETFIEADIISQEYDEKSKAMEMIAFLSVFIILFQTLDVLQNKVLFAVNNGSSPGVSFHLRVGILTGLLVTAPTLSTVLMSKKLNISAWLLFFSSGNCTIICCTLYIWTETALVALTWHTPQYLNILEDMIHYTRISKSFCLILLNAVQCYCRYVCPLFRSWWLFRLSLALLNVFVVTTFFIKNEINTYQNRNKIASLLNKLPDKTVGFGQDEGDAEYPQECAICYCEMTSGKVLPCKHVFHKNCLRRWFQVRTVCPFCNTEVQVDVKPWDWVKSLKQFLRLI